MGRAVNRVGFGEGAQMLCLVGGGVRGVGEQKQKWAGRRVGLG